MHQPGRRRQGQRARRTTGLLGAVLLAVTIGAAASADAQTAQAAQTAVRCPAAAPGSVNNDGYADAAVGEPGNSSGRGAVHLFSGHPRSGLALDKSGSAPNDVYLTQSTSGVPGTAERGDAFGSATLLADLNGDHCADLVVGSPGENDGAGWIQVFFGSPSGLRVSGSQSIALSAIPGAPRTVPGQGLGETLAAADVDGDGIDDLIAGVTELDVGSQEAAGGVAVVYGGTTGLQLSRSVLVTRDTQGVPGAATAYAGFGTSVAGGDFDGDGHDEIAVGASNGVSGGTVQLLRRSGSGFTGTEPIGPGSPGLPATTARSCFFGAVLASGDVNGDGRDDLAVADPAYGCRDEESDYGAGAVVLLPGSSDGLTTTGSQLWSQDSAGVEGSSSLGHVFGESLALAPLNRDRFADLVVGAPGDSSGGSATLLLGGPQGLTTAGIGGTRYTQSTPGIPGTGESGDQFGDTVTAVFAQSRSQASLVIGTPGEDVGKTRDAGAFSFLPIGTAGPEPRAARTITASTAGVQGTAGKGDELGGGTRRWG